MEASVFPRFPKFDFPCLSILAVDSLEKSSLQQVMVNLRGEDASERQVTSELCNIGSIDNCPKREYSVLYISSKDRGPISWYDIDLNEMHTQISYPIEPSSTTLLEERRLRLEYRTNRTPENYEKWLAVAHLTGSGTVLGAILEDGSLVVASKSKSISGFFRKIICAYQTSSLCVGGLGSLIKSSKDEIVIWCFIDEPRRLSIRMNREGIFKRTDDIRRVKFKENYLDSAKKFLEQAGLRWISMDLLEYDSECRGAYRVFVIWEDGSKNWYTYDELIDLASKEVNRKEEVYRHYYLPS